MATTPSLIHAHQVEHDDLEQLSMRDQGLIHDKNLDWALKMGLTPTKMLQSPGESDLAEQMLADELNAMSLQDIERDTFNVHGILLQEQLHDPDNIEQLLRELAMEIQRIGHKHKKAYDKALYLNKAYVEDRDFRLLFLRCDDYNVKVAAQRLVKHFDVKSSRFRNEDTLARDIRMPDFSEQDTAILNSGFLQILPTRDASGRLVVFLNQESIPNGVNLLQLVRVIFYIMCITVKDPVTQMKGVVVLVFMTQDLPEHEFAAAMREMISTRQGLPRKVAAVHMCFESKMYRPVVTGMKLLSRKEVRNRVCTHCGSYENIKFELQTYGICTDDLPVDTFGAPSTVEWHQEWIKGQQVREDSAKSDAMNIPLRFDCLFGRGRHTRTHSGNVRAGLLIDMYRKEYENANKLEKTAIAERIVNIIQESHGR